jgi:hypothetical protein
MTLCTEGLFAGYSIKQVVDATSHEARVARSLQVDVYRTDLLAFAILQGDRDRACRDRKLRNEHRHLRMVLRIEAKRRGLQHWSHVP